MRISDWISDVCSSDRLNSRTHFKKVEVLILIDDKLDRAGRDVVDRLRQGHRLGAHGGAGLGVEEGRRRLLHHLLVATLDRALALAEVQGGAVPVGPHLNLDVARLLDVLLDAHALVAEAGARLVAGRAPALAPPGLASSATHALSAAAGGRLAHHRVAEIGRAHT